jgi:hypothetical protein
MDHVAAQVEHLHGSVRRGREPGGDPERGGDRQDVAGARRGSHGFTLALGPRAGAGAGFVVDGVRDR